MYMNGTKREQIHPGSQVCIEEIQGNREIPVI